MTWLSGSGAYRAGMVTAVMTCFLTVWTTIVRDDGNGAGNFMVILAAGVGAFAASFRPAGMARAMLGVGGMQVLLGLLIATAPITASAPGGPSKVLLFNVFFTALWLISANFFRISARRAEGGVHALI